MKCLDTDLLIAILRGKPEAASKVKELDEEDKGATTVVNVFEIVFVAHKSANKAVNLKETLRLLERLEVTPLCLAASRRAAEIAAKLSAKGEAIDYRDAMIAGIVMENDLTLVTRKISHFARNKGLKLGNQPDATLSAAAFTKARLPAFHHAIMRLTQSRPFARKKQQHRQL